MIFHVAIAGDELRNVILAELGENNAERFLQKIREHVQPPTVRHAHANFLNTSGRTFVKDRVENHHQRFGALDREAFLADVTRVQENFERLGFHQRAEQSDFHLARRGMFVRARFEPVQHPVPHPRVLNVHELRAISRNVISSLSAKNFEETRRSRSFSLKPSSRSVRDGFSGRFSANGFTRAMV